MCSVEMNVTNQRYQKCIYDMNLWQNKRAGIHDTMQVIAMITCITLDETITVTAKLDSHANLQMHSHA